MASFRFVETYKEVIDIFFLFLYSKQEQEGYFEVKDDEGDCWEWYVEGVNDVFSLFLYSKQGQEEYSEVKDKDDDDDWGYLYDVEPYLQLF